jgi:hypothetical protein
MPEAICLTSLVSAVASTPIDPTTGQPYVFDSPSVGQGKSANWMFGGQYMAPNGGGVDATGSISPGVVSQDQLMSLPGYKDWISQDTSHANPQLMGGDSGGGLTDPVQQFLDQSGLRIANKYAPGTYDYSQAFDANNNPVGIMSHNNINEDPGNLGMMLGLGMIGMGFGGALAAGGGAVDGAGGMALQEGATPSAALSGGGGLSADQLAYGNLENAFATGTETAAQQQAAYQALENAAATQAGSSGINPWLKQAVQTGGKMLAGGQSPGGNAAALAGYGGGGNAGSLFRQQTLANALRNQQTATQYSGGPGWIPATGGP